jgi:hypothetical protein
VKQTNEQFLRDQQRVFQGVLDEVNAELADLDPDWAAQEWTREAWIHRVVDRATGRLPGKEA